MTQTEHCVAGTRSRQLWIPSGKVELEGELEIPSGAGGLVLFAHGGGNGCHSTCNQYVAQVVREEGLATLLLDLMTRAEALDILTRRSVPFDIELLAQRLVDATRWVRSLPDLAGLRLGFFGDSTGSAAALTAAAQPELQAQAVVSRGGRPDLAGGALRNVLAPTLLIVGTRDADVLTHNKEAFELLPCEKEIVVIQGTTHQIESEGGLDQVAHLAARWLAAKLLAPAPTPTPG